MFFQICSSFCAKLHHSYPSVCKHTEKNMCIGGDRSVAFCPLRIWRKDWRETEGKRKKRSVKGNSLMAGALSNLVSSSAHDGRSNEMIFKIPSDPHHSVSLWISNMDGLRRWNNKVDIPCETNNHIVGRQCKVKILQNSSSHLLCMLPCSVLKVRIC